MRVVRSRNPPHEPITSGLVPIQDEYPGKISSTDKLASAWFSSASPRCFDFGDVDLLHRHHRFERALCLAATSRKRVHLRRLLLKDYRRPADSLPLEGDIHFDTVGDLDEGNAAVHSVLLAVEGHRPLNRA